MHLLNEFACESMIIGQEQWSCYRVLGRELEWNDVGWKWNFIEEWYNNLYPPSENVIHSL